MNERFESTSPVEPRVFDRLVDGELTAAEERTLLASLDFQPDGWRRCALAFLESRAWKDELVSVTCRESAGVNGAPVVLPSPAMGGTGASVAHTPTTCRQWPRTIAIVASLGLAFVLGIAARGYRTTSDNTGNQIAGHGQEDGIAVSGIAPGDTSPLNRGESQPTVTMALVDDRGDIERQLEIPVVETDGLDPQLFRRPPSAIPPYVVNALRRSGHTVKEQRLFVPVVLDDGRQAIIPLDQAEVRYDAAHY